MKKKFKYEKYNYYFLKKKENYTIVEKIAKKLIGLDFVQEKSMDMPTGQLFYFDFVSQ